MSTWTIKVEVEERKNLTEGEYDVFFSVKSPHNLISFMSYLNGMPHKTKFVQAIAQAWFRTIGSRDQDTFQHEMKYFHEVGSYYCPYDPDNESGADLDYKGVAEKLANEIKSIAEDNKLSCELKSSGRQFSKWRERTIPDYFESELQSEKYVWELTIKA